MTRPLPRIADFIFLFVSGVVLGILAGALTNLVNGFVSPQYFRTVMGWADLPHIHRAIVAQGILEGALLGTVLGLVYTLAVIIISKWSCDFLSGFRYLVSLVLFVLAFWVIGGLIGLGLWTLSPEFYGKTFNGPPGMPAGMAGYAWVGGSIWGIEIGGICTIVIGSLLFNLRWKNISAGR